MWYGDEVGDYVEEDEFVGFYLDWDDGSFFGEVV